MPHLIFKYPIPVEGEFALELPEDGSILDLQVQGGQPFIWVLFQRGVPEVTRHFRTLVTGGYGASDIDENSRHIGTYQINEVIFVGHVFEIGHAATTEKSDAVEQS